MSQYISELRGPLLIHTLVNRQLRYGAGGEVKSYPFHLPFTIYDVAQSRKFFASVISHWTRNNSLLCQKSLKNCNTKSYRKLINGFWAWWQKARLDNCVLRLIFELWSTLTTPCWSHKIARSLAITSRTSGSCVERSRQCNWLNLICAEMSGQCQM